MASDTVNGRPALRRVHLVLDLLLVGVFLVGILLPPTLHALVGGDGEAVRMEYREPADFPPFELSAAYPRAFQRYYDDNFALRTDLVRWHNALKLFWLDTSPTPVFVVGRDGWLFYTGEKTIENHTGALRLTDDELGQWRSVLESRRDWLERRGIRYLFVVVPDKHSIYREKLPPAYYRPGVLSLHEQWFGFFRRESDLEPLALKPVLLERKEREELPLYYPKGTHWNDLGAWAAYEEIVAVLRGWFPSMEPLPEPRFVLDAPDAVDDNFGKRLLLREEVEQPVVSMAPPRRPRCGRLVAEKPPPQRVHVWVCPERRDAPSVMLFHDSQGEWLEPYFADTFSRTICILKGAFDRELIARERPDVVVTQVGERRLWRVPRR